MPTYTPSNNIKKIGTGDESGTWGDSTNNNFDIIDRAANGFYTLDIQTLDTTGSGTEGSSSRPYVLPLSASALLSIGHYKAIRLISSGSLSADTYLKLEGDNNARVYMMQNDTTSAESISVVVFQGTFSASRSAEVAQGQFAILFADGSGASTSHVRHVTEDLSPITKPVTIRNASAATTAPQLTVESTNTGSVSGPFVELERNPSEAGATNDFLGGVLFTGYNDAGTPEKIIYGSVLGKIKSPTDGSENGELNFYMESGGTTLSFLELGHASAQAEAVVNTAGADVDFRVEGDTLPNLFGTEASTDKVLAGTNAARVSGPANHLVQVEGDSIHPAGISVTQSQTTTAGPLLTLAKSKNGTIGSSTIVADGDTLGTISFAGDDGVDLANVGAEIKTVVDGTPDVNDIPAAMEFRTTAATESTPTTRLKIYNDGAIGVGTATPSSTGGNDFQILTSRGPDASPQWLRSPTAMEFIHEIRAEGGNNPSEMEFGLPNAQFLPAPRGAIRMFNTSAFQTYVFEIKNLVPMNSGVNIRAQVSTNGVFYDNGANYMSENVATDYFQINYTGTTHNTSGKGFTQGLTFSNASRNDNITAVMPSTGLNANGSSGLLESASTRAMAYFLDAPILGIQFYFSSGAIKTGSIAMYGLRKSFDYIGD